MKRNIAFLLTITAMLASCEKGGEVSSSKDLPSSEEFSSSLPSSEEKLHIPSPMVGTWYISSSQMGVLPLNGIFEIFENDTLSIGERTLSLQGHYAGYEEAYEFVYNSIHFIVSYDEEKSGIDWGYQNGEDQDFGFALSEPLSNKYDYEGEDYPMAQIKEYLGTSLDVPTMKGTPYKLKLYTSSLYNAKCAALEIGATTLEETITYISTLTEGGYVFSKNGADIKNDTFTVGYDANKTYSLRIIYFSDANETDVFFYNYNENIQ